MVNRPDRNEAQIRGGRARIGAAGIDGQVRCGVATLAVDQDEGVVRAQTAQGGGEGQGGGVGAISLGVE